jgi:hypothetical protein
MVNPARRRRALRVCNAAVLTGSLHPLRYPFLRSKYTRQQTGERGRDKLLFSLLFGFTPGATYFHEPVSKKLHFGRLRGIFSRIPKSRSAFATRDAFKPTARTRPINRLSTF